MAKGHILLPPGLKIRGRVRFPCRPEKTRAGLKLDHDTLKSALAYLKREGTNVISNRYMIAFFGAKSRLHKRIVKYMLVELERASVLSKRKNGYRITSVNYTIPESPFHYIEEKAREKRIRTRTKKETSKEPVKASNMAQVSRCKNKRVTTRPSDAFSDLFKVPGRKCTGKIMITESVVSEATPVTRCKIVEGETVLQDEGIEKTPRDSKIQSLLIKPADPWIPPSPGCTSDQVVEVLTEAWEFGIDALPVKQLALALDIHRKHPVSELKRLLGTMCDEGTLAVIGGEYVLACI